MAEVAGIASASDGFPFFIICLYKCDILLHRMIKKSLFWHERPTVGLNKLCC